MAYLKFDKTLLINLEKSLKKEMLRTNKSGAYSVTTITDCNTRKYHGLLVVPLPELSDDNYVLLSSLDETVIQHGAEFNMGIHKYEGDNYTPKGHKYIREFNIETVACTTYRVGGVIFSKERVFISHENRILIKYTLLEAKSPVTMRFKPFLAFRNVNHLSHENNHVITDYKEISNGIATSMYEGFPDLCMQFSKAVEFIPHPDWYRGIEYIREQERGYEFKEDLFVPGHFEMPIKKGESVFFSAGVLENNPAKLKKLYQEEINKRTSRTDFYHSLKNAAQQLYNKKSDGTYLMAGYPWFKCRARDQFMALPGASLATNDIAIFDEVISRSIIAIKDFMAGKENQSHIQEIHMPDVLLWFIWSLQQYALKTSEDECAKKYGSIILEVLQFIRDNKHPNLSLHDNGLLFCYGHNEPVSWMNGIAYGKPTNPRSGYLVEVNALWYNSLKFGAALAQKIEKSNDADILDYQAEFLKQTFIRTFWNGKYLHDYVEGDYKNWDVRPNMLFAASLPYSTLKKEQKKAIVDIVTRELLTPKGIRSLSPNGTYYRPKYEGDEIARNYNYHNGTVWPWLIGPYAEAYLKIYNLSGLSFMERMLITFEQELSENCIGTISELYDGNPPFKARGAISYALNVAELLRTIQLLKKYDQETEEIQ